MAAAKKVVKSTRQLAAAWGASVRTIQLYQKQPGFPPFPAPLSAYDRWRAKRRGDGPPNTRRNGPLWAPKGKRGNSPSFYDQREQVKLEIEKRKLSHLDGSYVEREVHARAIQGTIEMVRVWFRDWIARVLAESPPEIGPTIEAIIKTGFAALCRDMQSHVGPRLAGSIDSQLDRPDPHRKAVQRRHARRI